MDETDRELRASASPHHERYLQEAGYNGQTIRFMTTQQFDFHYKMSLVAAENMRAAGFTVDLQVLDWATQLQRRPQGEVWDIFFTHGPILPEPTLYSFFSTAAPGWWSTPARERAVNAFSSESNVSLPSRRPKTKSACMPRSSFSASSVSA